MLRPPPCSRRLLEKVLLCVFLCDNTCLFMVAIYLLRIRGSLFLAVNFTCHIIVAIINFHLYLFSIGEEAPSREHLNAVEGRFPRKIKMKRAVFAEDGVTELGQEEYFDYIFPDDEKKIGTSLCSASLALCALLAFICWQCCCSFLVAMRSVVPCFSSSY